MSGSSPRRGLAIGVALASLAFVALAAVDLDNVRPVGSDESWIVTVADGIAHDGSFAVEIIDEPRLFTNPPGQFLGLAGVFRLFGSGMAQARWVSVLAALVLVATVAVVATRWYGPMVAGVAVAMLFLWRSNATGMDYGLPLLAAARSARYDLNTVAAMWLAVAAFDGYHRHPSRGRALGVGVMTAAASLTHFYGLFMVVVLGCAWWFGGRPSLRRAPGFAWGTLGFLLLVGPYAAYVMAHWSEAVTQFTRVHGPRTGFVQPAVALSNVVREPLRYLAALREAGVSNWLFVIAVPPALLRLAYRARVLGDPAAARLGAVVVGIGGPLAIVDTTKAPIYLLPVLPALYTAVAVALVDLTRWCASRRSARALTVRGVVVLAGTAVLAEGVATYAFDRMRARATTPYQDVGEALTAALPASGRLAGAPRWAWALHPRPYVSLAVLLKRASGNDFAAVARSAGLSGIVIDPDARADVERQPGAVRAGFERFLDGCTAVTGRLDDATYGVIVAYAIGAPPCRSAPGVSGFAPPVARYRR